MELINFLFIQIDGHLFLIELHFRSQVYVARLFCGFENIRDSVGHRSELSILFMITDFSNWRQIHK